MTASPIEPGTVARDVLEAVREAIDIPNAATVGDQEVRDRILLERVSHVTTMLDGILRDDAADDVGWAVAYLRARLAEHPATGYRTWEEAMAARGRAPGGAR